MLGFRELLFTVIVVVAVWLIFRWGSRVQSARQQRAAASARRPASGVARRKGKEQVQDLIACPKCGEYVTEGAAHCHRPDCPHP